MNEDSVKISRVRKAILAANYSSSLQDIIDSDKEVFSGIRMLYSTDEAGAPLQVEESLSHVFSGIFSKNRLLAYSDSIRSEMDTGTSLICYKQRALFDTNLLSDLPKYVNGEDFTTKRKVEDIIEAVEKVYGGAFDYSFAMLENLREFICSNNPHPVNKVSAAIYLDHKFRGALSGLKNSTEILSPFFKQAESVWIRYRASEHMWELIDRRDLVYAVMLKTYHLCWTTNNITIEYALNQLVDYCLSVLGVLPRKELYFAWKIVIGFSVGYFTPVFDEKSLKSPGSKSIERIGALSWDLFIFRFSETLLTEEKENNFYIPSITTLDKNLLDTISSCPARAMISFPDLQYVETIFTDDLHFHQCLDSAMTVKQKNIIYNQSRSIKGNKRLRHYISMSVSNLESSIKKLI